MIATREELEATKMAELKQLIVLLKGDPSAPAETKPNLIDRILYEMAKQPENNENDQELKQDHVQEEPKVVEGCTIEEVTKAVNSFILRGMEVYHNEADATWLFRVKIRSGQVRDTNTGEVQVINRWREDSGTLKQPLKTIVRCASLLMQSASAAASVKKLAERDPSSHYDKIA